MVRHAVIDTLVAGASMLTIFGTSILTTTAPVLAGVGVVSFLAAAGFRKLNDHLDTSKINVKNAQIDKKNSKIQQYNINHPKKTKHKIKKIVKKPLKTDIMAAALQIVSMLILASTAGTIAPQLVVGLAAFVITKVIPNKTIIKGM